MSSIQPVKLSDAILELTTADQVYVRLALTSDNEARFEARCLVIDVIPQRWLGDNESGVLSAWDYENGAHLFESRYAVFFCGLRDSNTVRGWFSKPSECELLGFDSRPGHRTLIKSFYLPEVLDGITRQRASSYAHLGLPVLPYPSSLYTIQMSHPEVSHLMRNKDGDELVGWDSWAANTLHFDSFVHARAEIIFGETNPFVAYQRQDLFAIRVVHPEGWLKAIKVLPDRIDVTVAGTQFHMSQVILAPAEVRASSGTVLNHHVSLPLPEHLPQRVDVILVREDTRLDRAVFSRKDAPFPETSPQVNVKREDCAGYIPDESIQLPSPTPSLGSEKRASITSAPKVFISYSHDSADHKRRVLELADRLRGDGIECMIDRYMSMPPEGWPKWMQRQILDWPDYVIVVCTKTYALRFNGDEIPGKGLGAALEGGIITQQIYDQAGNNDKFIPVIFSIDEIEHIPMPLRPTTRYLVSTEQGYEDLYRYITNQPAVQMPPLGLIKRLPPRQE